MAITGRVWTPKPISCDLSNDEAVIVELREDRKSETRSANVWIPDSAPLREVVRETEWALVGGKGSQEVQVPIIDGRHAVGDFLRISGDQFVPSSEGLVEQVLGQLSGHKSLGVRRSELFLPVGTALTAVGELSSVIDHPTVFKNAYRSNGKMYVLHSPTNSRVPFILSHHTLPEMINSALETSAACSRLATWFAAAGVTMLAVSAYHHIWVWYREQKMRRRVENARKARQAAGSVGNHSGDGTNGARAAGVVEGDENGDVAGQRSAASEGEGAGLCVVCLQRSSQFVFPGCGHLCVCDSCIRSGNGLTKCPICRARGKPIRVYVT